MARAKKRKWVDLVAGQAHDVVVVIGADDRRIAAGCAVVVVRRAEDDRILAFDGANAPGVVDPDAACRRRRGVGNPRATDALGSEGSRSPPST